MKDFKEFLMEVAYTVPIKDDESIKKYTTNRLLQQDLKKLLDYLQDKEYSPVPIAGGYGRGDVGKIKIREVPTGEPRKEITRFIKDNDLKRSIKSVKYGKGSLSASGTKTPSGSDWENIITYQYNILSGNEDHDSNAKSAANEFDPIYLRKGELVAQTFYNKLNQEKGMIQFGAGKSSSNLSQKWKDWEATDGTPKTDMYTGDENKSSAAGGYNISLKKAGGSQIASGAKNETKAYFNAALEFLGDENNQVIEDVLKEVNNNFQKIATEHTATELADVSKRGNIDPTTLELFDKTEQWHKEYNKQLEKVFNETVVNNQSVKEWVIFEAMSGYTKFGVGAGDGDGNSLCAASVCIEFDPSDGKITSFIPVTANGMVSTEAPSISSALKSIAPKAKFYVAWKSSSGNPYSAFRISADKKSVNASVNTYRDIIRNEVRNDKVVNMLLTEDVEYLNEFAVIRNVFRKVKNMGKDAIKWVSNLMERVFTQFKNHIESLRRLGGLFFQELFQFLGIEIKFVSMSMPKELEGFV